MPDYENTNQLQSEIREIPTHLKRKEPEPKIEHTSILRFDLSAHTLPQVITLPGPCRIVKVGLKDERLNMWVMCSDLKPNTNVVVKFFATGDEIPSRFSYIDTVILTGYLGTNLVRHLCIDTDGWGPETRIPH